MNIIEILEKEQLRKDIPQFGFLKALLSVVKAAVFAKCSQSAAFLMVSELKECFLCIRRASTKSKSHVAVKFVALNFTTSANSQVKPRVSRKRSS